MNLSKQTKVTRVSNAVAAGTTAIEGAVIDMQGFEGVEFLVAFGTITSSAVTSIKLQEGDAANLSDAADLAGTAVTVADTDDNKVFVVDCYRPTKRYIRCVVSRGTANAVLDGMSAVQYQPRLKPCTNDATTVGGTKTVVSPAAGTP